MELAKGLELLKQGIDQHLQAETNAFRETFHSVYNNVEEFISKSCGLYSPLNTISEERKLTREYEPEGFTYGYEVISHELSENKIYFPLLYPYHEYSATAIEENSDCAHLLFNFALRSIVSFPMGDANVYMVDSNVGGDFNLMSKISTKLDEADADKPYFHYITKDEERGKLLSDLTSIMDNNIRNYVTKHPDLRSYNKDNANMHVPYHFVFIKDISATFFEKGHIDLLARLISSDNAKKAGIYVFYSFDKEKMNDAAESYYANTIKAINNLISLSHILSQPARCYADAEFVLEPKATQNIADMAVRFVETHKPPVTVMSFKDDIQKMLEKGSLWNPPFKRQSSHLPFIVGFQNAVTPKEIDVQFKALSPHIFIGGKTGSGKSVLLHNFIVNGSLRYSPEQLQFYLVDMKGGVSFVPYKRLPHVVALSASSSRHYAMSLLDMFSEEHNRRLSLFKQAGAVSLDGYNETAVKEGKKQLPFLFGIIDEFQGLFDVNDEISRKAEMRIREIHKLSRATGIFLALCTQQAPGNVDRSQVGIKMALVCNPNDSVTLIGNPAASRLRGIGRAIVNLNPTGEEQFNQEFQVAFIHEQKELPEYIEKIREIYLKQNNGVDPLSHLVYDDNDRRALLPGWILDKMMSVEEDREPYIYIGIPGFFRKEHVKFMFHRDSQSNVAIVGNDRIAALRLIGSIVIQFVEIYKKCGAKVYISDLQKGTNSTYGKLGFLGDKENVVHSVTSDLRDTIGEVHRLLCERKENPSQKNSEPEILYALLDIKPDKYFSGSGIKSFNFGEPIEKTPLDMLKELIDEGPDHGIHVLVYSYNYANLEALINNFNNALLSKMEIKIGLRGGNAAKLLRFYGSGEIVEHAGKGIILMPEDMGLQYKEEDSFGDPFLVYDYSDEERLVGSAWETLFNNLKDEED